MWYDFLVYSVEYPRIFGKCVWCFSFLIHSKKKHDSIKYVRVTLGLSIKICSQCFKPSLGELSQNYICKSYTEYNLFYRNLYARGMDETTTLVLCCKYLPTVFGEDYLGCKKSRVFQPQFMFQIFIGKSLQENIYIIFFSECLKPSNKSQSCGLFCWKVFISFNESQCPFHPFSPLEKILYRNFSLKRIINKLAKPKI